MIVSIIHHRPKYISVLDPEKLVKIVFTPFYRHPLNFTGIDFRSINPHHWQIFC